VFAVAGGGGTSIALLLMLIPSRSSAHTVHRKQEEEELLCAKVGERKFQNKEEKVATPIVFQKYTANWAIQIHIRTVPHRKTMKLQHFPTPALAVNP
jgi:hypothetical protein